jgi:hypothetical protein
VRRGARSEGDRHWRLFLRLTTAVALACIAALAGATARPEAAGAAVNAIQAENAKPGTTAWQLPNNTQTQSTSIQGYASEISVAPGDGLQMHVSTIPAASYRIEIYRLGWYHGAGGRREACLPSCSGSEPGTQQAVPVPDPTTGYLDAGWPVTDTLTVQPGWTSGYYLAKLVLTSGSRAGGASYIPFIVRAPPNTRSALLVQASVNTWQAYNNWGGKSLYTVNSTGPTVLASGTVAAAQVSFNRPFGSNLNSGPYQWEYPLVRYLERDGYDVTYQTDADTDQNPGSLLQHRLDIVSGHDEYWSQSMRDAFDAASSAGVNLAFLGGNIGYWQARYANGDRTLIEYRSATLDPDPIAAQKTVEFRNLSPPRPECMLEGIQDINGLGLPNAPAQPDYSVAPGALADSWFSGTGFTQASTVTGVVGYEWDIAESPGCPSVQRLFTWSGVNTYGTASQADAATFTASSGARVFAAGTIQFSWGLDGFISGRPADVRLQAFMSNLITDLGGSAPDPSAPDGLPDPVHPAAGAAASSPVTFRFVAPPTGLASYQLFVDNQLATTVSAASCANGYCSASIPLAQGLHSWFVQASDGLGNSVTGPTGPFDVDNTPPTRFSLRSPSQNAVLWSPRPKLSWTPSRDAGSGLALYVVSIDRRPVAFTTRTSLTVARDLADGRHTWTVAAVDRAGNQRSAGTRRFRIDSARVTAHSRGFELSRGIKLLIFCAHRCTTRVVVRLGLRGPSVSTVHGAARPGVFAVSVTLTGAVRRDLLHSRKAQLAITVKTRSGRSVRFVSFTRGW